MDTTVATIFIVSVAGLLFFLLLHWRGQRKQQQYHQSKRLIARNRLSVDKKDVINNQFIGLDKTNRQLLFCDFEQHDKQVNAIPFDQIAFYQLTKQHKEGEIGSGNDKKTAVLPDKIWLFLFSKKMNPLLKFMFFDREKNGRNEFPYLRRRAAYWEKIIRKTGATQIDLIKQNT